MKGKSTNNMQNGLQLFSSEIWVQNTLENLKMSKSPGPDGLQLRVLREFSSMLAGHYS